VGESVREDISFSLSRIVVYYYTVHCDTVS